MKQSKSTAIYVPAIVLLVLIFCTHTAVGGVELWTGANTRMLNFQKGWVTSRPYRTRPLDTSLASVNEHARSFKSVLSDIEEGDKSAAKKLSELKNRRRLTRRRFFLAR